MEASLDTNVIIHLYKGNLQSILFNRFEKIKVYEFIRNHEMENHAEREILDVFDKDVEHGKVELITDAFLQSIGMYNVFLQHVKDYRILFDARDLGEVYAIALAKVLGCIILVTDDIKERGPHYTLMRMPESDVLPFAFYELLFLDFLEQLITEEDLIRYFNIINDISGLNMDCKKKLRTFLKRFWTDPYTDREKEWMAGFCATNGINARERMTQLATFLSRHR